MGESSYISHMAPRISICIPTYNGERYLAETLATACAQVGEDLEILISDDYSQDGTLRIAKEFSTRDVRIRILENAKNLGLVGNWNQCILQARGEWIKFLFQDDLLSAEYLPAVRPWLDGTCSFIVNARKFQIEANTPESFAKLYDGLVSLREVAPSGGFLSPSDFCVMLANFQAYNFVGEPSNTMFRKDVVLRVGLFHSRMHQIVDFEFWTRIAVSYGLVFLPSELSTFRVHNKSASAAHFGWSDFKTHRLDILILYSDFLTSPHYQNFRRTMNDLNLRQANFLSTFLKRIESDIQDSRNQGATHQDLLEHVFVPWAELCVQYPWLYAQVSQTIPGVAAQLVRCMPGELS